MCCETLFLIKKDVKLGLIGDFVIHHI